MEKVIAVIDGFNYYHRIDDHLAETGINLKWLNYYSLINARITPKAQSLEAVYFFTAVKERASMASIQRHENYITALESSGVTVVRGRFNYPSTSCKICKRSFTQAKEKMTDVNIATKIVEGAFTGEYDTCFLFSGDNDLVPAIQSVKRHKPEKKIILFRPPNANFYEDLKKHCHKTVPVTFKHIKSHQFDLELKVDGQEIRCPYPECYPSPTTS